MLSMAGIRLLSLSTQVDYPKKGCLIVDFVALNSNAEQKLYRLIPIYHSSTVIFVDLFISILVCVRRTEMHYKKYYATSLCDENKA